MQTENQTEVNIFLAKSNNKNIEVHYRIKILGVDSGGGMLTTTDGSRS